MDISVLINTFESLYNSFGYPIVFFSSLIETTPVGWLVPGGLLTALGGFFAYENDQLSLVGVLLAGWLGMLTTLLGGYYLGIKTGSGLEKRFKQERNVKKARALLQKNGAVILTTSMIANLTRFWISYVAGTTNYSKKHFIFYAAIASLTWISLLVVVGYIAGSSREKFESGLASIGIFAWILVITTGGIIFLKLRQEHD